MERLFLSRESDHLSLSALASTGRRKSTLQARNFSAARKRKRAHTQAWTGQEAVRWGWPGGGSRAVRDVLCGKDTMMTLSLSEISWLELRLRVVTLEISRCLARLGETSEPFKISLRINFYYWRIIIIIIIIIIFVWSIRATLDRAFFFLLEEKLYSRCHKLETRRLKYSRRVVFETADENYSIRSSCLDDAREYIEEIHRDSIYNK